MSIAATPEHEEFARSITKWAQERDVRGVTRQLLEGNPVSIDALWQQIADFGWTGLLVPESQGGGAASWNEAVVLVEALARAGAPLPISETLAVSFVLAERGGADAQPLLKAVADGSARVGIVLASGDAAVSDAVAISGAFATHLAVVHGADVAIHVVDDTTLTARAALDPASGTASVSQLGEPLLTITGGAADLRTLLDLLVAADSVGTAEACLAIAVEYAHVREAFGRKIGSFQAVKHHCANMLLTAQAASASVWRAAAAQGGPDAAALVDGAAFLAAAAGLTCAKTTLQVLGGIGFTWEHDLHLYMRRAGANLAVLGPQDRRTLAAGRSAIDGTRPTTTIALPESAQPIRAEVAAFREKVLAAAPEDRHGLVVDAGYLHPGWPTPWGRGADPLEQLVVEEVLHDVDRVSALGATYWEVPIVLPTIVDWGTPEQIERWMRPSMMGEIHWCQLFSEPSAGSDLAALQTKAVKTEGGWLVTGQKVWTSDAHNADMGMALVRTDPDVKKHKGITCMMLDMHAPGVEVRPLRQITGEAHFNEVFLDEVFVPDADVLGPVNSGWSVTLTTLGHERMSLGGGANPWTTGEAWDEVLGRVRAGAESRPEQLKSLGHIVLTSDSAFALHLRSAYRALLGQPLGVEGTIGKTVVADLAQRVGDFALELMAEHAFTDGAETALSHLFLAARMATIAGGTSEILRSLLAEQALGLPREPATS